MLLERLDEDQKTAMRSRDDLRLRTIRMLRAAVQQRQIELRGTEDKVDDAAVIGVLQKQAKQRRDAMEQYRKAGREDLAKAEEDELGVIEGYLPAQLDDEEIRRIVAEIVNDAGAKSMKDMGRVMGPAMQALRGKADGKRVQTIVKDLLAS